MSLSCYAPLSVLVRSNCSLAYPFKARCCVGSTRVTAIATLAQRKASELLARRIRHQKLRLLGLRRILQHGADVETASKRTRVSAAHDGDGHARTCCVRS